MNDLLAKLGAASEGSESLDKDIARHIGFRIAASTHGPMIMRQNDDMASWDLPKYSRSLDAKLPEENIYATRRNIDGSWSALNGGLRPDGIENGKTTKGTANTEALARRIAALKARQ